jgi:hypothetical protein
MHVSCIQAGTFLARLGRPEVANCIAGLDQYSWSYEEAGEQSKEMRRLYDAVSSGENELSHMDSVTPRIVPTQHPVPQMAQQHEQHEVGQSHGAMMEDGPPTHSNGNVSRGHYLCPFLPN